MFEVNRLCLILTHFQYFDILKIEVCCCIQYLVSKVDDQYYDHYAGASKVKYFRLIQTWNKSKMSKDKDTESEDKIGNTDVF